MHNEGSDEGPTREVTYEMIEAADSAYAGFPSFAAWADGYSPHEEEWDEHIRRLESRRERAPLDAFAKASTFAVRAAALDTGAIEGLYSVDRGFTFAVAAETATWQIEMAERGEHIRPLFDAHLDAYELVLDAATQQTPISEAWIRRLHEVICAAQDTYRVLTPQGFQEQRLPKAEYKTRPNHPYTGTGRVHSYAPVAATPNEMHSLVEQLQSEEFLKGHPVLQASYGHYAIAAIHPFADGNGRVARALASVYLYRPASVPLVIYADQRERYLAALEDADAGRYGHFAEFIHIRALAAIERVGQLLEIGTRPPAEESITRLRGVGFAYGGLTFKEVDTLAVAVMNRLSAVITEYVTGLNLPSNVTTQVATVGWSDAVKDAGYRRPINPSSPNGVRLTLAVAAPADAQRNRDYQVLVATSERRFATLLVRVRGAPDPALELPLGDVNPELTEDANARLQQFVAADIQSVLAELSEASEASLKAKGY